MIRRKLIVMMLMIVSISSFAQAPKWAKNAAKSLFTLTTFKQDGSILSSSNGFFVSDNGECVSNFEPFTGAYSASIVDANGKKYNVVEMLGANDMYDVAKFKVDAKTSPVDIATGKEAEGSQIWLMPYSIKRDGNTVQGTIRKSELFGESNVYYTFSLKAPDNAVSCPIFNQSGQAIALLQKPATSTDTLTYGISAAMAAAMKTNGLSVNDVALRTTNIKIAMPDDHDQANIFVLMTGNTGDSLKYVNVVNDFIEKFPEATEGYTYRAQQESDANNFTAANNDMLTAIKMAKDKAEAHYSFSKLIYQKELTKPNTPFADWNLDRSLEEASKAYAINKLPMYQYQQALVYFAQKKYDDAYNIYTQLFNSPLRNASLFYEAARCKEMAKAPIENIIALVDSSVNCYSQPYVKEAAPYLLARAQYKEQAGKYREAVSDYNEYEKVMIAEVNDKFYYTREQAEVKGKLYQQAINDISTAITKNPTEAIYYAEQGSLQLRVNLVAEAEKSAQDCIKIDPKYADGYLVLGLAQVHQNKKAEGIANFNKAKELGSDQAEALIKKYSGN